MAKNALKQARRSWGTVSREIQLRLIDVTPPPVFAGFERTDDRVIRRVEVLGGVFVLGRIAATDVSARQAQAKVHPTVTCLQTLFATARMRVDIMNLI
jgi:hypothetical protein